MKRTAASSATVGALFVLGIIIGAGAIYGLGVTSNVQTTTFTASGSVSTSTVTTTQVVTTTTSPSEQMGSTVADLNPSLLTGAVQAAGNLSGTFTIGVLNDLTSELAGEGKGVQQTTSYAIQDINTWLGSTSLAGKVKFNVNLQDYALDNTKATAIMNSFLSSGIRVVVGPLNSGTTGALLPFANSHNIVMISESSTAPSLSIPGDYLYRTPPSDNFQGQADSIEFVQSGAQAVVIVYRNDDYGAGLANATATEFEIAGGHVIAQIPYDTTTSNFLPTLASVNDAYNSAVGKYDAAHVALYFISFSEFGQIAIQAQSNYPSLLKSTLPWFGADGEGNEAPIVNSTYASAVVQTRMAASFPGFSKSGLTDSVCQRQLSAIGVLCDGYTTGAYDDAWLAALSILYCHGQDGPCIKNVFPAIANTFHGATGVTLLNSGGDRLFASYVFFCIAPGSTSGTAKWIICGTWDQATNKVIWTAKPQGIP